MSGIMYDQVRWGSNPGMEPVSVSDRSLRVKVDASTVARGASGIYIPNGGITETQLNASVAGAGLAGGGGSALSVNAGGGVYVNSDTLNIDNRASGAAAVSFASSDAAWTFANGVTAKGLFVTGTPFDNTHVVNKAYVDSMAGGLHMKSSSNAATPNILDSNTSISGSPTYDNTANTTGQITATLAVSGVFTVDGHNLVTGERLLVKAEDSGTAEVMSVDTVADSGGSLNSTYWVFYTSHNQGYYVWYNVNSAGTDPTPTRTGKTLVGIEVALATNDTAVTVATATKAAIDTAITIANSYLKGGKPNIVRSTNELTLTNAEGGDVPAVADGSATPNQPTGFTFGTDTEGTGMTAAANGIWDITISGTSLTLNRSSDFDGSPVGEVSGGAFTFIDAGTLYDNTGWVVSDDAADIKMGTATGQNSHWTQFSGAGAINAGVGLTKSGDTLNVGSGVAEVRGGINFTANDIAVALEAAGSGTGGLRLVGAPNAEVGVDPSDGIGLDANGVLAKCSTATVAQQYGGLVNGRTADGSGAASAGAGFLAIKTDNSSLEVDASNQIHIKAVGVATGMIAADAVTIGKINLVFNEESFTADSFTVGGDGSYHALAAVPLLGAKVDWYAECYRNGVADMTNKGSGVAATTATEFRIYTTGGNRVTIGADITATGNTYRVRYLSANS